MGYLTALKVNAPLKPGRHQDGDGLMLVVKESGRKTWVLRAQVDGKRRDFGLGSVGDTSLKEAREKAAATRKLFRGGDDPVAIKRAAAAARRTIPTFKEAAEQLHGELDGSWKNDKHRGQWLSTLTAYVIPKIGDMRIDRIDTPMIVDALLPIWLSKQVTARRVRQRIAAVLDWAHAKGFRPGEAPMRSVAKGLPKQAKSAGHFAAMPYADVPALMGKLAATETIGRLALRFTILTAARSGEVRGATWAEIDEEASVWTIPGSRMKAGKTHMVPLSLAALAVLQRAKDLRGGSAGDFVFPSPRGGSLSDMTLGKVLHADGGKEFTVHGFRSSFRDWAAEKTATPGDVVEAALAHTISNKVEAAYRRTNYLEKRRDLMNAWANYLS